MNPPVTRMTISCEIGSHKSLFSGCKNSQFSKIFQKKLKEILVFEKNIT